MRSRKSGNKASAAESTEKNTHLSPSSHLNPTRPSHTKVDSPEGHPPEREINFAVLEDGSLVDVVEDAGDPDRTLLAIFKGGRVRFADRLEHRGQILVPIPRNTVGFSDVKLPRGIMPYGSVTKLAYTIHNFIRRAIDVPKVYGLVLAAFVLYSWVADRLPTSVYLSITGLPIWQKHPARAVEFDMSKAIVRERYK